MPLVSSWPHSARLFVGFLVAVSLGFLCGWASLRGECVCLVFILFIFSFYFVYFIFNFQHYCSGGPRSMMSVFQRERARERERERERERKKEIEK